MKKWKESLEKNKRGRVAKVIGVPTEDDELFPEWDEWLRLEKEGGVAADAPASGGAVNGNAEEDDEDDTASVLDERMEARRAESLVGGDWNHEA